MSKSTLLDTAGKFLLGKNPYNTRSTANTTEDDTLTHPTQHQYREPTQESTNNDATYSTQTPKHPKNTPGNMPDSQTTRMNLGVLELADAIKFTGSGGLTVEDFIRTIAHHVEAKTNIREGEEFEKACLELARTRCDYRSNERLSHIVETLDCGPSERNTWARFKQKLRTTFGETQASAHGAFVEIMVLKLESFRERDVAAYLNQIERLAFRWAGTDGSKEEWSLQFGSRGRCDKHLKFISICALASCVSRD